MISILMHYNIIAHTTLDKTLAHVHLRNKKSAFDRP